MSDYRHRPRQNTPHVVKVYDTDNGSYLGRIVDITADGMMVVTRELLTVGRMFQLRIILPVIVHDKTDVVVPGRVVWCTPDANPSFCKAGFQFTNLDGETGFLLEDVMHKLNLVG